MQTLDTTRLTPPLMLYDRTAAELMTPNPKSVRQTATARAPHQRRVPADQFGKRGLVAVREERAEQGAVGPGVGGDVSNERGEAVHAPIMSPAVERLAGKSGLLLRTGELRQLLGVADGDVVELRQQGDRVKELDPTQFTLLVQDGLRPQRPGPARRHHGRRTCTSRRSRSQQRPLAARS